MSPGPAAAAIWVATSIDLEAVPILGVELLAQICIDQGWFDSYDQAVERAERWEGAFMARLRTHYNERTTKSRPVRYAFNDSDERYVQGTCFSADGEPNELRSAKSRRVNFDRYRTALADLEPRQFEAVCRGILALIGCPDPRLTPRANDQGIDVFGELDMRGRLDDPYYLGGPDSLLNSWIVGQAKQYTGSVSTPDIREFIGSVDLAMHGIYADAGQALDGFAVRPYDPVHRVFLTTGTLTRDSWSLADQSGVRVFDGDVIAALLADHDVGCADGVFSGAVFAQWVDRNLT